MVAFTFAYGMPLPEIKIEVPQRDMAVFQRMRNANLSPEFKAYSESILKIIGSRAVRYSGDYIMAKTLAEKEPISPITLALRRATGDGSRTALIQQGEMLRGLFAEVSRGKLDFGVRGPRAGVARLHENGFAVRVSQQMVKGFIAVGRQYGIQDVIKWIKTKDVADGSVGLGGEGGSTSNVIKIPRRPFLSYGLDKAVQEVMRSPEIFDGLDNAMVSAIAGRIFGGVVEYDALKQYGRQYTIRPVK